MPFVTSIRSKIVLSVAAIIVCIKKIGIVYLDKKPITFPKIVLFSVLFATRRITEKHAISPNMNVNAPGTTSFTYARMLNMTNIKPLSTPNFFFPCNCTLNTQILIPSTNQISFVRTVDTAYISVPPPR